jgi:hypothetical protein
MTQAITPLLTEPPSTCASCAYFQDFNDARGRGLCKLFDSVARRHHWRTSDCDASITTLEREKGLVTK